MCLTAEKTKSGIQSKLSEWLCTGCPVYSEVKKHDCPALTGDWIKKTV